ncbi:MAG: hypothetical protein CFE21_03800 [Bacteroidetes bacterium B1(2017)]|nr:MAG: hypothetical protein CFE21_03800 [Bacteroidetes bacterium B1(2017)]
MQKLSPYRFLVQGALSLLLLLLILAKPSLVLAQSKSKVVETYENGKVKSSGHFIDHKKTGIWLFYHTEGWLLRKEKWRKGKMLYSIEYNEKRRRVRGVNSKGEEILYRDCGCNH